MIAVMIKKFFPVGFSPSSPDRIGDFVDVDVIVSFWFSCKSVIRNVICYKVFQKNKKDKNVYNLVG